MTYLKRDERKTDILNAAVRLLSAEGFSAFTIRRVAAEAGIAVGLIHRHFSSVNELRAAAFAQIAQLSLTASLSDGEKEKPRMRLIKMLCNEEEAVVTMLQLWNEATLLSEHEPLLKKAFIQGMQDWRDETAAIIEEGQRSGIFRKVDGQEAALRLIGLSCGLSGMFWLGESRLTTDELTHHIGKAIDYELKKL